MRYDIKEIKSDRLVIKKGIEEDYLKVYEYDYSKLKNIDNEIIKEKQDLSKIKSWFTGGIDNYYKKLKKSHAYDWIIYLDDVPIGNVLALEIDKKSIEITYNLHPNYWKNGYMTESLFYIINYLFFLGYEKVINGYLECDINAKRISDKIGFRAYEILKDYVKGKSIYYDLYKTVMDKTTWFLKTGKIL